VPCGESLGERSHSRSNTSIQIYGRYGEPPAQLSAARVRFCSCIHLFAPSSLEQLWAIMWRNCSEVFVAETASRKFLITLEELITSSGTSPVVRERLLDVVGAAAYNSQCKSSCVYPS